MNSLVTVLLLISALLQSAKGDEPFKEIRSEVIGMIDFKSQQMWLSNTSDETLLIVLSGSVLNLDDMLKSKHLVGSSFQQGIQWLMVIPKGKPSVRSGIKIINFNKVEKFVDNIGYIELSSPVYVFSKDDRLTGPYHLAKRIKVFPVKEGDLDEGGLHLLPFDRIGQ